MTPRFLPPVGYYESCVPRAAAALMGLPVHDVVRALYDARAARRNQGPGGRLGWGTHTDEALDVFLRLGHPTEVWGADGTRMLDADLHRRYLAARRHALCRSPRRRRRRRPRGWEEPPKPLPDSLTVAEWCCRFDAGGWLLVVGADRGTHAVGIRDGVVIEGGVEHAERPVLAAYRFT